MLALIKDNEILTTGPDGRRLSYDKISFSPAEDGLQYEDYRLAAIQPADPVPEGKRVVSTSAQLMDGVPQWVHVLEDVPVPTPEETRANMPPLTARQLRLGLVAGGFTLAQVDTAINSIEDEQARAVAQIEWQYASKFERLHPLIDQVSSAFGLTPEQVDAMWDGALEL